MEFLHYYFDKLKKNPAVAASIVCAAVFSILIVPEEYLGFAEFYILWVSGCLMIFRIWLDVKEDVASKVSGIVPAWIYLAIGIALLSLRCQRPFSLYFVLLAVSAYSGGIIMSIRLMIPLAVLIIWAPYMSESEKYLNDFFIFISGWIERLSGSGTFMRPQLSGSFVSGYRPGLLLYQLLLMFIAAVTLVAVMFKTPAERLLNLLPFPLLYILSGLLTLFVAKNFTGSASCVWCASAVAALFSAPYIILFIKRFCSAGGSDKTEKKK